jgi:HK97 family phage major capsid protein
MRTHAECTIEMRRLRDELGALAELPDPSAADSERFRALVARFDAVDGERLALERSSLLARVRSTAAGVGGELRTERGAFASGSQGRAGHGDHGEARSVVDRLSRAGMLVDAAAQRCTQLIERGPAFARDAGAEWIRVAGDPDYLSAFLAVLTDPAGGHRSWSDAEHAAWRAAGAWQERAVQLNPDAAGGYLAPVALDPAVILTGPASVSAIRQISRVVTIASEAYHGFSTNGVTAEWLPESVEAADFTPTWAPLTVPVHKWSVYAEWSYEAEGDIPALVNQLQDLMRSAVDEHTAAGYATGTGTNQPRGLLTALGAATGVNVTPGTAGTIGVTDPFTVAAALPVRYRANAQWLGSQSAIFQLMQLAGQGLPERIANEVLTGRLLTRALVEDSHLPDPAGAGYGPLIYGDFSRMLIVDRVGATVEMLPVVVGTNRRPVGRRGLQLWGRTGSDVLTPDAFRVLNA